MDQEILREANTFDVPLMYVGYTVQYCNGPKFS